MALEEVVYSPGDYVIRQDEPGAESWKAKWLSRHTRRITRRSSLPVIMTLRDSRSRNSRCDASLVTRRFCIWC